MITITRIAAFVPESDFRCNPTTLWRAYCEEQRRKRRAVPTLECGAAAFFLSCTERQLAAVFNPFEYVSRPGTRYESVRGGQTSFKTYLEGPFSFYLLRKNAEKMGLKIPTTQYKTLEEWWQGWKAGRC